MKLLLVRVLDYTAFTYMKRRDAAATNLYLKTITRTSLIADKRRRTVPSSRFPELLLRDRAYRFTKKIFNEKKNGRNNDDERGEPEDLTI